MLFIQTFSFDRMTSRWQVLNAFFVQFETPTLMATIRINNFHLKLKVPLLFLYFQEDANFNPINGKEYN